MRVRALMMRTEFVAMAKLKLFKVVVHYETYVVATTPEDAEDVVREFEDDGTILLDDVTNTLEMPLEFPAGVPAADVQKWQVCLGLDLSPESQEIFREETVGSAFDLLLKLKAAGEIENEAADD